MPSINEVIERVNRVRPDAVDDETKAAWLLELDGQLFQNVIQRHQLTAGREKKGSVSLCPSCGGNVHYDSCSDASTCACCGWSELPDYPKNYPEDGDKPLLVSAPYDRLYDLYLMSNMDFLNLEFDNYNNTSFAYNAALDEWQKQYHRCHMPLGAAAVTNLF